MKHLARLSWRQRLSGIPTAPRGPDGATSGGDIERALRRAFPEQAVPDRLTRRVSELPCPGTDSDMLPKRNRAGCAHAPARRWRFAWLATAATLVLSVALGATNLPLQVRDWLSFRGNAQHTGYGGAGGARGRVRWVFQCDPLQDGRPASVEASPILGPGGLLFAGSTSGRVYAIDRATGRERWHYDTGGRITGSCAVGSEGTVYVGSWDGVVYALEADTGALKWEFRGEAGVFCSSPALGANGTLYIGSNGGHVYALNGATGNEVWRWPTDWSVQGGFSSSCAVGTDGTVYVGLCGSRDHYGVYALDGETGEPRWVSRTTSHVISSPAVAPTGVLYVGCDNGKVMALEAATGATRWQYAGGGEVRPSPTIGPDGTVYVGSWDRSLYALDGATGAVRWRRHTGYLERASTALALDGTLYASSGDRLRALDSASGDEKWSVDIVSGTDSSPAVDADGTVYVGTNYGRIYAVR